MEKFTLEAYLANDLGFNEKGRNYLYKTIMPNLKKLDIIVHEPFRENGIMNIRNHDSVMMKNTGSMKKSKIMIPIIEGVDVDSGISSEIAEYAVGKYGKIIALRTDSRMHQSGFPINPQVLGYIEMTKGILCRTENEWYAQIRNERKRLEKLYNPVSKNFARL
jgi:hypothetical protein